MFGYDCIFLRKAFLGPARVVLSFMHANVSSEIYMNVVCRFVDNQSHSDLDIISLNDCNSVIFSTGQNCRQISQSIPFMISSDRQCVCPICGFRTMYKNNLTRHMANHSKEKPHKCEYCLKTFRRKDYLKQHILYHKDVAHPLFQPDAT